MTDKKEDGWFGLKEKLFDFMLYHCCPIKI